jgi:hypothetical protein
MKKKIQELKKMNDQQKSSPLQSLPEETYLGGAGALQQWIIALFVLVIASGSVVLSLKCLQTLPDDSTKPFIGSLFYLLSSIVLCCYFVFQWKAEKIVLGKVKNNACLEAGHKVIVREYLSQKILKWIITIFAVIILLLNIATANVCVYGFPDKTLRPLPKILYMLIGFIVIGILVYKLWKERFGGTSDMIYRPENNIHKITTKETHVGISGILRQGLTTLIVILISFCGVGASFICLYSLPDNSTRPFIGSLFHLFSSLILCFYFVLLWKSEKVILCEAQTEAGCITHSKIIGKEFWSGKIIKWATSFFAVFFGLSSIAAAIICIFMGLPDKSVRPDAAVFYLFSGLIVISVLVFTLWENKITRVEF